MYHFWMNFFIFTVKPVGSYSKINREFLFWQNKVFDIIDQKCVLQKKIHQTVDSNPSHRRFSGSSEYLRPSIISTFSGNENADEDLRKILKSCWSEDELERPDFIVLKHLVKKFRRYLSKSLEGDQDNYFQGGLWRKG